MTESHSAAIDLRAVFDAHVKAEFVDKDVTTTTGSQRRACHLSAIKG